LARFLLTVVFLLVSGAGAVQAVGPAQFGNAVVAVVPAELTVEPGATFTIEVTIRDVSDLGSYEFVLAYDPTVVQTRELVSGGFVEGSDRATIALGPDIDNEAGRVTYGIASFGDLPGVAGSGTLAVITLEALADGVSRLELIDSELQIFDAAGARLRASPEDGRVQVGSGATATPEATVTPTEVLTATPGEATAGPTEVPTATPGEATAEPTAPTATRGSPVAGEGETPGSGNRWLIVGGAVLGVAGILFIVGGLVALRMRREGGDSASVEGGEEGRER
jgi:hypothetical protein